MKNKTKKYYIIRFVSFCLLLIMGLYIFSYISLGNDAKSSPTRNQYFQNINAEGENTIDVLFVGDSTVKNGIIPNKIWKDIGVTSYILGYGYATLDEEYYDVKKMFKKQKPKYLLLETSFLFDNNENNKNECQQVSDYFDSKLFGQVNYYFPLMRYKSIFGYENNNLFNLMRIKPKSINDIQKGYVYYNTDDESQNEQKSNTKSKYYMIENDNKYFKMYYDLCSDNNCELVTIFLPQKSKWSQECHNTIKTLSEKYDVKFIDYNIDTEKMIPTFSLKTDYRDGGTHLNYSGATKLTKSMEKYMVSELHIQQTKLSQKDVDKWNKHTKDFYNSIK